MKSASQPIAFDAAPKGALKREITTQDPSETLLFAASELAKYLRLMSERPARIDLCVEDGRQQDGRSRARIALRLLDSAEDLVRGLDARLDDAIRIDITDGAGVISGLNGRSVLIGVYRFLHEAGCRWVRPGADGEFVPRVDIAQLDVHLEERPSYRHRCICIEGAVSLEDVLAMVDWAPKVGFSGYFMQFTNGYSFFERWYAHHSTALESEPFSEQAASAWAVRIEHEIARRSLVYQAIGHGWSCMALGLDIAHWNPTPIPPEAKGMLAEVRGERALQWDRPMITSLCYSQPEVRRRMIAAIADHAVAHPEIDLLNVCLEDGRNQKCSCEACRGLRPSEIYVSMLRGLDRELTARNCATRIVFLAYSDLLWAPQDGGEPLDPSRFVFMYANSRACYAQPLKPMPRHEAVAPAFTLNKNSLHQDMTEFQGFLQEWQAFFAGDSFIFEYHPIGSLLANQVALARVIHQDVRQLRRLGLYGWVSCQLQRAAFPSGICDYMLGRSLWRDDLDPTALIDDYLHAAYGRDSALCKEFLTVAAEELEHATGITATGASRIQLAADAARHLAKLGLLIDAFEKVVERNLGESDPCRARSWNHLRWYLRILRRLAGCFAAMGGSGDPIAAWAETKAFVLANESRYRGAFDTWAFISQMDAYLVNGRYASAPEEVMKQG